MISFDNSILIQFYSCSYVDINTEIYLHCIFALYISIVQVRAFMINYSATAFIDDSLMRVKYDIVELISCNKKIYQGVSQFSMYIRIPL